MAGSDYMSNDRWEECRRLLDPSLDPQTEEADQLWRRCSEILFFSTRSVQVAQYQRDLRTRKRSGKLRRRSSSPEKPFTSAFSFPAVAGREFIVSLEALEEQLGWLFGTRDGVQPRMFRLSNEARAELREVINALDTLHQREVERMLQAGDFHAPNSKPWLHDAVHRLLILWHDAGQADRQKREFEAFALAVLAETKAVTPEAIKRSLDRHVRPNFRLREQEQSF